MDNYLAAQSVDKEEFDNRRIKVSEQTDSTLTSDIDVGKIERILGLTPGLLKGQNFYLSKMECSCGRTLSFYDLVFTALVEQWHSPSFLAHTLVGDKYFVNKPRPLRCSNCGTSMASVFLPLPGGPSPIPDRGGEYETPRYGCCYA